MFNFIKILPITQKEFYTKNLILHFVAIILVSFSMSLVWSDARKHDYVPCVDNCGENFLVFKYGQDFNLYGFKYGLIEDYAVKNSPDRIPLLYTHNPNLPGILFALMEGIGIHELENKQILTLVIHGIGLLVLYICILKLTGSLTLALFTLLFFCFDYSLVFNFAMNPLRAWHWLAIFGQLLFSSLLARKVESKRAFYGLLFFSFISFGLGYDFYVITSFISFIALLLWYKNISLKKYFFIRKISFFFIALLIPIIIRQVQIYLSLGFNFWITDFKFTVINKIPIIRPLFDSFNAEEISKFYKQYHVVHFSQQDFGVSLADLIRHIGELTKHVLIPDIGLLSLLLTIGIFSLALFFYVKEFFSNSSSSTDKFTLLSAPIRNIIICLALGSIAGIAIFPFHNTQIYIKHLVPLIGASIYLCKSASIVLLIYLFHKSKYIKIKILLSICIFLILVDHFLVQKDTIDSKNPFDTTWITEVKKHEDSIFAITWMPTAVSIFTKKDVVFLTQNQLEIIFSRIKNGESPIESENDYSITSNSIENGGRFIKPDFLLYFPVESRFDSTNPICRYDYLTNFIYSLVRSKKYDNPQIFMNGFHPADKNLYQNDYLTFHGNVVSAPINNIKLRNSGNFSQKLFINCRNNSFSGWIKPSNYIAGNYSGNVFLDTQNNFTNSEFNFKIGGAKPSTSSQAAIPFDWIPIPPSSIEDILIENPQLKIASKGRGWIIFDLRPYYK